MDDPSSDVLDSRYSGSETGAAKSADRSKKSSDDDDRSASKGAKKAGRSLQQAGQRQLESAQAEAASRSNERDTTDYRVPSYRKGGRMKKDGVAMLHRSEKVERGGKRSKGKRGKSSKRMRGRM